MRRSRSRTSTPRRSEGRPLHPATMTEQFNHSLTVERGGQFVFSSLDIPKDRSTFFLMVSLA